jgi:hypothetical protein
MATWLRYLIAFVVFCHGFVYVRIGSTLPGAVKEWRGRSWLLGPAVTADELSRLATWLHVAAGTITIACALAIALAPAALAWRPLAFLGALVGLLAFAAFWDGETEYLAQEGAIGGLLSLALLAAAIAFPRAFA